MNKYKNFFLFSLILNFIFFVVIILLFQLISLEKKKNISIHHRSKLLEDIIVILKKENNNLINKMIKQNESFLLLVDLLQRKNIQLEKKLGVKHRKLDNYIGKYIAKVLNKGLLLKDGNLNFYQRKKILNNNIYSLVNIYIHSFNKLNNIKLNKSKYVFPVNGYITSNFGFRIHPITGLWQFHSGIDIAANYMLPIRAFSSGYVVFSGYLSGYGYCIKIKHNNNLLSLYGHCCKLFVKSGDYVKKGEVIGLVGNSGFSTGPHLHFEIRKNGIAVDPLKYFNY